MSALEAEQLTWSSPPADTALVVEYEWIFQRADRQIIVQRWRRPDKVWELSVIWPSGEIDTEGFFDLSALTSLHNQLERELARSGWALQTFRPERRRTQRRGQVRPQSATKDRRKLGRVTPLVKRK
jgi:hypothetical protein